MSFHLTLGRHQLTIGLSRKIGRPRKTLFLRGREFLAQLLRVARDSHYPGNHLSRVFRFLFENQKLKKIFGFNLAVTVLFGGVAGSPGPVFNQASLTEITTVSPAIVQLTTDESVRTPLDNFKINQGYSYLHPAIDLQGQLGDPVYPIMDGIVEGVFYDRFSYGNHILIDHGAGFESLYAHLAKILVQKDEPVDKNTVIGTIGVTGWSTGPHLHLETWDNGRPFNPLTILK
jgi:murein DD-endopeptidase MepM/ murein hydrolase activator NlpD